MRRLEKFSSPTLLLLGALVAPVLNVSAGSLVWTNRAGGNLFWSNGANWTNSTGANGVPTANDDLNFRHAIGVTNAPGLVNNIVAADMMVGPLVYEAQKPGYHTTLINPGVTLTVTNPFSAGGDPFGYRGALSDSSITGYVTIRGTGRLVVGDPDNPNPSTGNDLRIHSFGSAVNTNGPWMATLDLSGLDYFATATGEIKIGASATSGRGTRGTMILAKTNLVIAGVNISSSFYGITIGAATGGDYQPGGSVGELQLGQENDIRANAILVGSARAQLGTMRFQPDLINPRIIMRNKDGVSEVGVLSIGDNYRQTSTAGYVSTPETSTGNLDLTGGTVDILVRALRVGRSIGRAAASSGSGNGTLTWTAGTLVSTGGSEIGRQNLDSRGSCTGVVNVRSNALWIGTELHLGGDAGAQSGTGNGTLNIVYGGQVFMSDNILEDETYNTGSSTINLTNGSLTVGGDITVDRLNYSGGTVSCGGALGLTNLNVYAPASAFSVVPGQSLAPAAAGVAGKLAVNGGLTFSNATLKFDLSSNPANRDQLTVSGNLTLSGTNLVELNLIAPATNGSYTLATYGTLTGNASNLQAAGPWAGSRYTFTFNTSVSPNVTLQVGGAPGTPLNLTWSGDGVANVWDLQASSNWNSGTQKFFNSDTVSFTDSGLTSPAINLIGALQPGSVTVNSSQNYFFAGNGKISSGASLTKLGAGTLSIYCTNDYAGATVISSGSVLVNGGLGDTAVSVGNGALLGGNGVLLGPVTIQSGGRLSPGASIGTLTVSNNLVLSQGCTNLFEVNTDTLECDQVRGLNNVSYGGSLLLNFTGSGAALSNGAALKLFSATSFSAGFTTILPATPGAGLAWDWTGLTNGTLRIVASVSVLSTNLSSRRNGDTVELSWPAEHVGWLLESQTNSTSTGLSTNWYPVTGSVGTNWLNLPVDPTAGTVFYRLRYAPTMKELRRAAANRRRRIIFNNDGGEPARSMTEPTVENLLSIHSTGLEGTQVDSIFYCPRCSGFGLFTYFTSIGSIFTSTNASYGNNMMGPLLAAGIDPLRVVNEFAHSNNIEFFCSFRMNDLHDSGATGDGPVIFAANALKVNHPEYLMSTINNPPLYGEWSAVNYARPEIREFAFRIAEEVCTNYNVDGIELDFFRNPFLFASTAAGQLATSNELNMMTDLIRQIRTMTDEVGRQRGRPILIAMRVPDDVSFCRAVGIDLQNWLAEDLLDILVVSGYFKLNDWDYSIALARTYGVKVYPSLDECRLSDATAKALRSTELTYRGRAANIWRYGADGVYIFNYDDPMSPLWQQLGDTQVLDGLDKDYFGSFRGRVMNGSTTLPYSSYQETEILNPSNTKSISPGGSTVSRINIGEDLSQAGPVNLKFRLLFSTAVTPANLTVTCNSQPLTFAGTSGNWVEYFASKSVVQQVTNHIRVSNSGGSSITWQDLMLQVRH